MDIDFNTFNRTLLFAFYFLILSVEPRVGSRTMAVRAPELFGDGQAALLQSDTAWIGLIHTPDALYVISGARGSQDIACRIIQIAGQRSSGEVINGQPTQGSEVPVPCYLFRRGGKWVGWILFRGHERAFCAAESAAQLPVICRLRP